MDDALLSQQSLDLKMIVGHFPEFVRACLKSFSEVIAEREQLNKIFNKKFNNDFFSSVDELFVFLKDSDAFS